MPLNPTNLYTATKDLKEYDIIPLPYLCCDLEIHIFGSLEFQPRNPHFYIAFAHKML